MTMNQWKNGDCRETIQCEADMIIEQEDMRIDDFDGMDEHEAHYRIGQIVVVNASPSLSRCSLREVRDVISERLFGEAYVA
jgi:hypothetical protein